jgi:hypothetical protein
MIKVNLKLQRSKSGFAWQNWGRIPIALKKHWPMRLCSSLRSKQRIVEAHRPGQGPKFFRVEMSDMSIIGHGTAVVVTCKGRYGGPQFSGTLSSCVSG